MRQRQNNQCNRGHGDTGERRGDILLAPAEQLKWYRCAEQAYDKKPGPIAVGSQVESPATQTPDGAGQQCGKSYPSGREPERCDALKCHFNH